MDTYTEPAAPVNNETALSSPVDSTELVSSAVVNGFDRVEMARGLLCPDPACQAPLTPQCTTVNDTVVEVTCSNCHVTVQRFDLAIKIADDDFGDEEVG